MNTARDPLPPWWVFAVLVGLTFAIYQPAWHGGFLWDDDGHVTPVALRSVDGLRRIWIEPGATQQYYPLLHTAFWLQHRLWGDATTGYHLVSIGLHALSACLVVVLALRLGLAGSVLAGLLFAVHPVQVESVAWISEQKNTLSAVFFLASAIAYLRFDEGRRARHYVLALAAFVLALLSKTVTATLPAALLVVCWWRRGSIDVRRDLRPLLPFFLVGLGAAVVTVWVERTFIGAVGAEFALSPLQRVLLASRAVWFYLATLLWPIGLSFNYPRWRIGAADVGGWLAVLGLGVLLAGAWRLRTRSRAPLAALVAFVVLLSPALGFVDVYPFRYSFVADHFQYLACVPVVLLGASAVGLVARAGSRPPTVRALAAVIVIALCVLTWRHSRTFADVETLYAATLERNPRSWLAHTNLGTLRLRTDPEKAIAHLRAALAERPDLREARVSLGFGLQQMGKLREAEHEYREAIRHHPESAEAHSNLCSVLQQTGDPEGAVAACRRALQLHPVYANAHRNLAMALARLGRGPEALTHYTEALRLRPSAELYDARGLLLQRLGRPADAAEDHAAAISLQPDSAPSFNNLGGALQRLGRTDDAIAAFERAVRLQPDWADPRFNLAYALQLAGRPAAAIPHYQDILARNPNDVPAWINLGVALQRSGRATEAIAAYREALRLDPSSPQAKENLAALSGK